MGHAPRQRAARTDEIITQPQRDAARRVAEQQPAPVEFEPSRLGPDDRRESSVDGQPQARAPLRQVTAIGSRQRHGAGSPCPVGGEGGTGRAGRCPGRSRAGGGQREGKER